LWFNPHGAFIGCTKYVLRFFFGDLRGYRSAGELRGICSRCGDVEKTEVPFKGKASGADEFPRVDAIGRATDSRQ
jgi:hypothetical protein